jgi:hypothetical protein
LLWPLAPLMLLPALLGLCGLGVHGPGPPVLVKRSSVFATVNRFCVALLRGRAESCFLAVDR